MEENQRNISMQQGNLQRFMSSSYHFSHRKSDGEEEGEEEIELSLGLSLNGRFGIDPRAKKLCRSSSIPDFINNYTRKETNEGGSSSSSVFTMGCGGGSLVRTCSLPTETDEEWRKRKEIQSLRRLEAKRKRSEKQKNFKAVRDKKKGGFVEENCDDDKRETFDGIVASQPSIGSQGSGSSGLSELDSKPPPRETQKSAEARSPASVQSTIETEQKPIITPQRTETLGGVVSGNQSSEPAVAEKKVKEAVMNILEDMPCVSTTGDGPNGKRIEGFLYRYRKGEEVRIVCVCHGSFLSPAEFVKHAGCSEVEHPLKRIVVNPSFVL